MLPGPESDQWTGVPPMSRSGSRRRFLAHAGAAGAAALGLRGVPARAQSRPPSEKLNLAIIGCGGQGGENLRQVASENIVALCDVDDARAAPAFERHPKARR